MARSVVVPEKATAEVRLLNQIVHEGDEAPTGKARPDSPLTRIRAAAPATARAQAAAMLADRDGALTNHGHKDHAAAVKKFHELTARL